MFKGLFGKGALTGTVAVFDIVQGSVGGALVIFKKGEPPLIRYAHRVSYRPRGTEGSQADDEKLMLKALRLLAERVCTHALPKALKEVQGCRGIDDVVAFVGAPWVTPRVIDHALSSEKPITVTDRWLSAITAEVLKTEPTAQTVESTVLEATVLRAYLNGYRTNDPRGKAAKRIGLTVFEAQITSATHKNISEALAGAFHTRSISLRSALLASFTVVRDHFDSEDNFLLFTVGSQVSEIALVREDALASTTLLNRGSHTLLEAAAARFKSVPEEVASMLRMHVENTVHEENQQMQADFALLESEWQQSLDQAFTVLKSVSGLPRTLFLSAPLSTRSWFTKLVSTQATASHTLTREPFRVIALSGDELLKHHHIHTDVVPDGPLSLETLFLHKEQVNRR